PCCQRYKLPDVQQCGACTLKYLTAVSPAVFITRPVHPRPAPPSAPLPLPVPVTASRRL
ncbi:hypothetical protein AUM85_00715, partial [Cronobacter sakazakii]